MVELEHPSGQRMPDPYQPRQLSMRANGSIEAHMCLAVILHRTIISSHLTSLDLLAHDKGLVLTLCQLHHPRELPSYLTYDDHPNVFQWTQSRPSIDVLLYRIQRIFLIPITLSSPGGYIWPLFLSFSKNSFNYFNQLSSQIRYSQTNTPSGSKAL
jgi:hypothetical protein